jgi:YD repeat-containing protein
VTRALLRALAFLLPLFGPAAAAQAQTAPSAFTTAYRYDSERRLTGTIAPDPDEPGRFGTRRSATATTSAAAR